MFNVTKKLESLGIFNDFLRGFLRRVSPGTSQLLNYDDDAKYADQSGNPFLFKLNRDLRAAPTRGMSLIAGNDSASFTCQAGPLLETWIDNAIKGKVLDPSARDDFDQVQETLSLGNFLNGVPSDGIVPITSAHGERQSGYRVRAIAGVNEPDKSTFEFNHMNAGTDVPISGFIQTKILPTLSDWVVEVGDTDRRLPTQSMEGFISGEFEIDFNAQHGDITGVLAVAYVFDGTDTWRVVAGADPDTLEPDTQKAVTVAGNSRLADPEPLTLNVSLPMVDPGDPSTQIQTTGVLIVRLGPNTTKVPPDPTKAGFSIPGPAPSP
jgi:hypothetical protein